MKKRLLPLALLLCIVGVMPGDAKPKPKPGPSTVPGGANQKEGVEGKPGEWLFNGKYRLRVDSILEATPEEITADSGLTPPDAGEKLWVLRMTMKFGQKQSDVDTLDIAVADADDITLSCKPYLIRPNPTPMTVQGGAWKQIAYLNAPGDFTPAKLVVTFPTSPRFKAFRIRL